MSEFKKHCIYLQGFCIQVKFFCRLLTTKCPKIYKIVIMLAFDKILPISRDFIYK